MIYELLGIFRQERDGSRYGGYAYCLYYVNCWGVGIMTDLTTLIERLETKISYMKDCITRCSEEDTFSKMMLTGKIKKAYRDIASLRARIEG